MTFTLPSHLRKKDEDTIALMFERAVVDEINDLTQKYSSAAVVFANYDLKVSSTVWAQSQELLIDLFCDATGNINETSNEPPEAMMAKAVLMNDEAGLMRVMKRLFDDSIKRKAERNVENFIPEEDF
ncbi:hypothetical protein ACO0K2_17955 [Undibacterium sp. MH2W]|uniref:hypothetical protein n=1 Tax=Undibacterium sp. MH2W TaxID=3413044 RepID=UPI003BEF9C41